jgi:hypothetical protein
LLFGENCKQFKNLNFHGMRPTFLLLYCVGLPKNKQIQKLQPIIVDKILQFGLKEKCYFLLTMHSFNGLTV